MTIQTIESLLDHPDPGFVCWLAGDRAKKEGYVKRIEHLVNPPADATWLKKIPAVPGADAAKRFYARHNGALLYTARDSMGGLRAPGLGVEIFPIDEWDERTQASAKRWEFEGYDDSEMVYGRHDFVAFADSRGISNYIHWVVKGPAAGTVYRWPLTTPPRRGTPPLCKDFGGFIELICNEPVRFFNELMDGHWRAEEVGLKEWIPSRYVADCGKPLERFTDDCRKALAMANREAQRLDDECIFTHHVLLGVLAAGVGPAAEPLARSGINIENARSEAKKVSNSDINESGDYRSTTRMTPRAKRAVEYALEQARRFKTLGVNTGHLLLGLMHDPDSRAYQILI